MKRSFAILAVFVLVAAACGDSDDGDTTATDAAVQETGAPEPDTSEPAVASGSVADLAITEVVFGDHVTITNLGSDAVSVDGLWVCNRPNYSPLPTAVIAPGESLQVAASDLGGLSDGAGEVALYTSNSFGDSSAMLDYVNWGNGGGRASVADDAGLWPAGDTVAAGGGGISAPAGGASAADWS